MNKNHLKHVQEILSEAAASQYAAGASCLVFQGGREQGYWEAGLADREAGKTFSRGTICRMYSMTKPVTSAAVMMLVEQGRIDLMDDVAKFIPEFAAPNYCTKDGGIAVSSKPVTIQDLLNMTSGLTYGGNTSEAERQTSALIEDVKARLDTPAPVTTMEFARRLGKIPLAFEPGTDYQYGLSADVLGAVVETVSGMRLGQFLKSAIFDPLGMSDTAFLVPEEKQVRLAQVYQHTPDSRLSVYTAPNLGVQHSMNRAPAYEAGGAGLVSTIDDYMRFTRMLLGEGCLENTRILQARTVRFMTTAQLSAPLQQSFEAKLPHLSGYTYANLLRILKNPEQCKAFGTAGEYGWDGWLGTFMMIDPANDLSMVFLTQLTDSGMTPVVRKIKNVVYAAL